MAELRTEEEQVQALKAWWDENGKSLLLGIAVALAAVLGWNSWQEQKLAQAENSSILYQNFLDSVVGAIGPQQDEAQLATTHHLGEQLKTDYKKSVYANYAAFIMARVAVEQGELNKAVEELDWLLANQPAESLFVLAKMRKARIIADQGAIDEAISIAESLPIAGYLVSLNELKGDLYLMKDDLAKARVAYETALNASVAGNRPILEMKLNDLAAQES